MIREMKLPGFRATVISGRAVYVEAHIALSNNWVALCRYCLN